MLTQRELITTEIDRYLEKIFAGEALLKEKKFAEAIAILESAKNDSPNFPDAYILLAKTQEQMANADESQSVSLRLQAVQHYTFALKLSGKNNNVLLRRAGLLKKLNSHDIADIDFETAKKGLFIEKIWRQKLLYPHLLKYSENYFAQFGTAEDLALSNATFANVDAESSFLGYVAESENKFALAAYYFEKAVKASPLDFYSKTYQHHLQYLNGNKSDALAGLNAVVQKYKYPLTHWFLALNYLAEERQEQLAALHFNKFVTTADLVELYYFAENERSMDLMLSHLLNLNIDDVNSAPGADQLMVTASLDKQIKKLDKLSKLGKYHEVAAICDAAIPMNAKSFKLFSQRGHAHYALRNYEQAKLDFSICLLLIDKNLKERMSEIILARSYTHLHSQDFFEAKSDYKDACHFAQQNSQFLALTKEGFYQTCHSLGINEYDKENYLTALNYFELASIDKFNEAERLTAQGKSLKQLKRYEEAITCLRRAKDLSTQPTKVINLINDTITLYNQQIKEQNRINRAYNVSMCEGKIVKDDKSEDGYKIIPLTVAASTTIKDIKKTKRSKVENKKPQVVAHLPKQKKERPSVKFCLAETMPAMDEAAIESILQDQKVQADQAKRDAEQIKKANKLKQKENAKLKKQMQLEQKRLRQESKTPTATQQAPIKTFQTVPLENFLPHCLWKNQRLNLIKPISEEIYLPILPEELEVFATLEAKAKALNPNKTYQHYICGASIWERLREAFLGIAMDWDKHDSDFITELPCSDLADAFATTPSESIPGLVSFSKVRQQSSFPLKVDIMHVDDLSNIDLEAAKRDYLPCYLDKNGKLYDPQNCMMSILYGVLKPARPLATLFKDEPIIILRTVYQQVKRGYNLPKRLRKQIELDKHLLLESLTLPIKTVNIKLKELFSKHYAAKTFKVLYIDKLIDALFPNIAAEIIANRDWLEKKALVEVASDGRPPLERTYALLIFAAVVGKLNLDADCNFKDAFLQNRILMTADEIIRGSSLFSQCFSEISRNDLRFYLDKAFESWSKNNVVVRMERSEIREEPLPKNSRLV